MKVELYKLNEYNVDKIKKCLEGREFSYSKVLVKVNCLFDTTPDKCVTTHPAVVEAVIKWLKKRGVECHVGDSPATGGFKRNSAGFVELCERENIPLVELDEPVKSKGYFVSSKLSEYDAIVNVCKMKTHMLTGLTGAVKNMYGIIPGRIKSRYHVVYGKRLPSMILDLYKKHKPVLNIMDGIMAMEGNGPGNGNPKKVGYLLISEDGVALDRVCAGITGHDSRELPVFSCESGEVGFESATVSYNSRVMSSEELDGLKVPLKKAKMPLKRVPNALIKPLMEYFSPRPVINNKKCIKCGKCVDICPEDAVVKGKNYYISRKCVKCYCCYEVCPGAIELRNLWLVRAVKRVIRK